MMETFLLRAVAAGVGLAVVAAPLGCVVVWSRMAYFGETVAQASLLGVAIGLMTGTNVTLGVFIATLAVAGVLVAVGGQRVLPADSVLGLIHHGALALGVVAAAKAAGPSVDLMGYLFGDVFSLVDADLMWIYGGGILALVVLARLWEPLLRRAVHEELAAAEGVPVKSVRAAFIILLSLVIAVAVKIVGILLAIAFLIVPAVAARPLATTPERMAALAAGIGVASVLLGLWASARADIPGGPAIVLVMAALAALSLGLATVRGQS